MAIPKRNNRGLQNIHTLSGRVDQTIRPDKAYMKISCLEMEKLRREKERESAMIRVNDIDVRLRKIEIEKAAILMALGDQSCGRNATVGSGTEDNFAPGKISEGFKLRY